VPSTDEIEIEVVQPEHLTAVKTAVLPYIDRAVRSSNGEQSTEGLFQNALNGNSLILTIEIHGELVGASVVSRQVFPSGKSILYVDTVGGEGLDLWAKQLIATYVNLAQVYKCQSVVGSGRSGWGRFLLHHGFSKTHITMELEV